MHTLWQDLSYGLRMLLKHRGFTAVAVLSLALGIGANSAIFSLADALLLRPLPVPHPGEVLNVRGDVPENPFVGVSYRDYLDLRSRSRSFDGLAAYSMVTLGFSPRAGAPARLSAGLLVSDNFFRALRVDPEVGRGFRPEEQAVPGRNAVAVISRDLYEREFHADPSVIGRTVRLNGIEFTVVGVVPESLTGIVQYFRVSFYIPLMMGPRLAGSPDLGLLEKRDDRSLTVKGRLKPDVSQAAAQAELKVISKNLQRNYPETNRNYGFLVRTELQDRIDRSPPDATLVAMLLGIAAVVLIIACANVANLLLSRAGARSREMAVRLAIGAGRWRLIRQLLTESLLIALAGGAAGLLVAGWGVDFLSRLRVPTDLPVVIALSLNRRALIYTLLASVVSAIFFGLAPAIHTTRTDLVPALRSTDSGVHGKRRLAGRNALVAGQVALSVMLLAAASMFLRGLHAMLAAGPGYRTDHLLMLTLDPTLVRYSKERTGQFYRTLEERARTLPGVKAVALANAIPMGMQQDIATIVPEGFQLPPGSDSVSPFAATVSKDYFAVFRIPILRGRGFRASDTEATPRVAVVNEVLAGKYWPHQDPIGKRFRLDGRNGPWVEIVGVARTAKYIWIAERPTEFLYLPASQNYRASMTLVAESTGDPAELAEPLRRLVRSMDADQPVYDVRTMGDFYRSRAESVPSLILSTIAAMGLMGLLLALVGLYGLVSYTVSRQTREIGIRMALGADRRRVLRLVLRKGFALAGSGVLLGMCGSVGVRKLMQMAYGRYGLDPVTMLGVPGLLLAIAMLAALVPAVRASRIDPTRALRYE